MRNLTLMTDLYQLTMGYGLFKKNKHEQVVVFDLFFRRNKQITYSIAAGLEQAVEYLLGWRFDEEDIDYLRSLDLFDEEYLAYLKEMRFTGDLYAVKEGEPVFPSEPILTIKAPVLQAMFAESALLNIVNHQTLIATKAAKICRAAGDGTVMEFGLRRAQGPDAGIYGARAAIIGGCASTSNVYAAKKFGVPVSGTMAHSWVMSYESEYAAFRAYADVFPDNCLLLVDTYDTLDSGMPNAIKVFKELSAAGHRPKGVRLDSGNYASLSKQVRKILDDEGFMDAVICASGDLEEHAITALRHEGARIDCWGVGTRLITSESMPSLGGVYKMSAMMDEKGNLVPKIKLSNTTEKITNPSFKRLYRLYDNDGGKALADLLTTREDVIDETQPLTIFHPVDRWKKFTVRNFRAEELQHAIIEKGKVVYEFPTLMEIQAYSKERLNSFWGEYLRLDMPQTYKVDLSQHLLDLKVAMIAERFEEKLNEGELHV